MPKPPRTTTGLTSPAPGEAGAGGKVMRIQGQLAGGRPQRVAGQTAGVESLQVVAGTQRYRQMPGDADGVLRESGILGGVGMGYRVAEVLDVISRHQVGIGAQRRE